MIAQLTSPVTEVPLERLDELSPKVQRVRAALARDGAAGVLDDYERRGGMDVAADRALDDVSPSRHTVMDHYVGQPMHIRQALHARPVERGIDGDE